MKKISLILAMLCLGITMTTSSAMAFSLAGDYLGPIQFKYNNWDMGTLYAPGSSQAPNGAGDGNTDSYGIFQVTEIQGYNSTTGTWFNLWTPTASEALEGIFYGLDDDGWDFSAGLTGTIDSVGGKIAMYLGPSNLTPITGPGPATPFPGLAQPADIWSATDGTLFLSADFVPGISLLNPTTTYRQTVTTITQPIEGDGSGYLSLTGGSHYDLFNSDLYLGGTADLYLGSHFSGPGSFGWVANSFDPVQGAAVPEPTSMLLFGMGMLGLATRIRRKKAA